MSCFDLFFHSLTFFNVCHQCIRQMNKNIEIPFKLTSEEYINKNQERNGDISNKCWNYILLVVTVQNLKHLGPPEYSRTPRSSDSLYLFYL